MIRIDFEKTFKLMTIDSKRIDTLITDPCNAEELPLQPYEPISLQFTTSNKLLGLFTLR